MKVLTQVQLTSGPKPSCNPPKWQWLRVESICVTIVRDVHTGGKFGGHTLVTFKGVKFAVMGVIFAMDSIVPRTDDP